ncbi:hypothetical protein ACFLWO_03800 [Chloroflexota bacterium]
MKKVYSETVVDHAITPRNVDSIEDADGTDSQSGIVYGGRSNKSGRKEVVIFKCNAYSVGNSQ